VFDINGSEFLLLLIVAVVIVGPERLPKYAEQLGSWVRTLRGVLKTTKARVDEELGDNGADVDWTALDPRRYDPRRIVREALLDDTPQVRGPAGATAASSAAGVAAGAAVAGSGAAEAAGAAGTSDAAGAAGTSEAGATTGEADVSGTPYDDEAT